MTLFFDANINRFVLLLAAKAAGSFGSFGNMIAQYI
jgi:hypothetical protein